MANGSISCGRCLASAALAAFLCPAAALLGSGTEPGKLTDEQAQARKLAGRLAAFEAEIRRLRQDLDELPSLPPRHADLRAAMDRFLAEYAQVGPSAVIGPPPDSAPYPSLPARTHELSAAERQGLPDIGRFLTEPSPQFLIDWQSLRRGSPYLGLSAARPHTGGHVYFRYPESELDPKQPRSYPPIYAVADGIVTRIDDAFRLQPVYFPWLGKSVSNVRYGVDLAIAAEAGEAVTFHYSIEPMVDPGDPEFYKPFLRVTPGQRVRQGDVIAHMYLPADRRAAENTHIHFNLIGPGGQFQAPSLFRADIAKRFQATWEEKYFRGDWPIPPCFGFRLDAKENPFGSGAKDAL